MKVSSLIVFASFVLTRFSHAADATSPVDYTLRNDPFSPVASFPVDRRAPLRNGTVQEQRAALPATLEKQSAVVGVSDRAPGIAVAEVREKNVQAIDASQPEGRERVLSPLNQRVAPIATGAAMPKPARVAKYQDSLAAASAANMARFPALERGATAKINRFVFRKNAAEPAGAAPDAPVTPAAGGSPVRK